MFKAAAKLRLNSRLDDLARSSPVRERDPDDLPSFNFPRSYAAEPILFSIVSPLDPNYVDMPLHKDGEQPFPTLTFIGPCRVCLNGLTLDGWTTTHALAVADASRRADAPASHRNSR
jgi:hypothetical protein